MMVAAARRARTAASSPPTQAAKGLKNRSSAGALDQFHGLGRADRAKHDQQALQLAVPVRGFENDLAGDAATELGPIALHQLGAV
jgi:hypothetical protein